MHPTKTSRARRARLLVPSALAVVILSGAAAPAGAVEGDRATVRQELETRQRAAAGPIDDLVNGILESIKALLPAGVTLPDIKIPEIKLPEIKLPEIPGVELPQIPGVELPEVPPLTPPTLPAPVESVPEIPDLEIPEVEIPDLP
ncbi:hypothetical protein [Streptomyces subrutilus]|uniref:hypothetical protein n=1 Tax=Streptomyces subrutilus TaxID=36818 RepID=UPI0033F40C26